MPRKPRMYLAGVPAHVIQRGNNREACFFEEQHYLAYKNWLSDACTRYRVNLYAYVLMTNHVHLLLSPSTPEGISRVMQSVGRRYVQYINRAYRRTGTLWESRHKASLVDTDNYLLACYRYIELNPVRAGIVTHPADYPWSSYRCHGYGEPDVLITHHQLYLALGDEKDRPMAYRELFRRDPDKMEVQEIRHAANFSLPLGNDRFSAQIEDALGRSIGQGKKGRPRKIQRTRTDENDS